MTAPTLDRFGMVPCRACEGTGQTHHADGTPYGGKFPCEACDGEGAVELPQCLMCPAYLTVAELAEHDCCAACLATERGAEPPPRVLLPGDTGAWRAA